jgi:type IV pilus assembly protein PilB
MLLSINPKPLGELLIGRGFLQRGQLDLALVEQKRTDRQKLLGEILVEQKWCSPEQISQTLAASYGIPFARITPKLADPKVIDLLPRPFLERNGILPLFKVEGILTVAVPEPSDVILLEEIERLSGCKVQVVAATAQDIRSTLQVYLPQDQVFVIDEVLEDLSSEKFSIIRRPGAAECSDPAALDPMVARLVRYSLYTAAQEGATEIHFEPAEKDFRIRYRIDGRLTEKRRPPHALLNPAAARLKWMAELETTEVRKPQDGVVRLVIDGRPLTLTLSTAPTRYGEMIVLRMVEIDVAPLHLEKLGFAYDTFKLWRKLITLSHGLVLVTGPSGSGKRTTLYSSLRDLNAVELNLCTAEDPIEASLPGVNQMQVDDCAGLAFPAAIAALLRQSPDVLMISDIRDVQTARLAARAAVDGRLVFGGACAADAPSAISWLINLGAEPYLLGAALTGVLAQRLVRKLCQGCKEAYQPAHVERRQLERNAGTIDTLYRPKGCARCRNIGYSGRIAIHELLIPDDTFRERLSQGAPQAELRELALRAKLKTLRTDGVEKIKAGITTLDEIYRVTA